MKIAAFLLGLVALTAVIDHAQAGCITMPTALSVDTQTTLSIRKKADGIKVQKLCPGVDYIVAIQFPEPRKFLMTCTSGILEALTGPCTNQTQKTTANMTFQLPLTLGCDVTNSLFAFKLASKIPGAAAYLSKNISFPLNPLSACPKSRCNLASGSSPATMSSMLSGIPLFDLFNQMGVGLGLGSNELLNFDISKLNKTMGPEAFLQALMSLGQLKMMTTKALFDPTTMLSLLAKFSSITVTNGTNTTSVLFYKECSKLLTLWPTFWGVSTTSGLYTSQWTDMVSQFIPSSGSVADNFVALKSMYSVFFNSTKNPADSMLSIMNSIGNIMSEGDFASTSTAAVSVTSFMGLLGSYTGLLALVTK